MIKETAPPGMEDWIRDRKSGFKEQYGDRWEKVLYAAAWKEKNKKLREQYVREDEGTGPANQMGSSGTDGNGGGGEVDYAPPLLGLKDKKEKKTRTLKRLMSQLDKNKKLKSQLTP